MDVLQQFSGEVGKVELFLIGSIILFIGLSFVFLTILLINRAISNRRLKTEEKLKPQVEKMLFSVMFDETPVGDIIDNWVYQSFHKKEIFIKMLIKSCFEMHQLYSGEIASRLEEFYLHSGLKEYSVNKLTSNEWHKKCQGIRELSKMNQEDANPAIALLCFSKHQLVKQTAFVGIINLKGIIGLQSLNKFTEFIDDWTLAHILIAIEKSDSSDFPDIGFLLHHQNSSMILLGLQLIRYFSLSGYQHIVESIQETSEDERIQQEILMHVSLKIPQEVI